ncbi:MAG: lysophospholipid acyltransferase family protein [Alphaproteobacteria bacterium]|nr:lysophospholipid acyltransferase family protein [Alphaproteobacteria bacterium]
MAEVDEFSYASPEDPRFKRLVIQLIERISGQPDLKRMYLEHQNNPKPGESFWDAAISKLGLKIAFNDDALSEIPSTGPVILVANHPFGVLDGLVICWLIARVRKDFKVLTNALLNRAEEIKPFLLPIDFEETKAALETNIKSRAECKALLERGGALIIFPGGTVSTTPTVLARKARDPEWKTFTARMIVQGKAPVVPVFFAGQNSRLFQVASHVSMTLRLSLLFKEVHDRIGGDLTLRIGKRIPYDQLKAISDRKKLMEFLRDSTYALEESVPKKSKRPRRRRELVE